MRPLTPEDIHPHFYFMNEKYFVHLTIDLLYLCCFGQAISRVALASKKKNIKLPQEL